VKEGIVAQDQLDAVRAYATRKVTKACRLAANDAVSPRMKLTPHRGVSQLMFSKVK